MPGLFCGCMQRLCLFCVAYEAVWPRTNGQFLTGCWLLFALFFKGLSTLAAFILLCALQALPVNVIIIITVLHLAETLKRTHREIWDSCTRGNGPRTIVPGNSRKCRTKAKQNQLGSLYRYKHTFTYIREQ